ncbi:MAG: NADH-quinone oxidoreductase subunit C [Rhizobiales bacterium]|nr:NADH-quinone oxidoreductase subunit C [Hyphomicrobiales bacterium]
MNDQTKADALDALRELTEHVSAELESVLVSSEVAYGELNIVVVADQLLKVLKFLRDDPTCRFVVPIDITGVDYPGREKRFDVVYHLLSPYQNQRIRVKVETDENTPVPSAISIFPMADWFERETYDLYGILFSGHPDLRRILTDYGFDGHPLRKDFPTTGYKEVRYDDEQKRVVYEPVKLAQEFRSFDYVSPWEGTDYVLPGDEKAN